MTKLKVSPEQRKELRATADEFVRQQQPTGLYPIRTILNLLDDLETTEARLTAPFTRCQPQVGECRLIHGHMGRHNAFADWPPPLSNIAWEPND